MRILSFDTSAEACSVALLIDDQSYERVETSPRQHAQMLLPFIQSLLNEHSLKLSDLNAIAFGCGPGSFTGLRIAAGVAQGLSYGSACPVLPVSNLRAMAFQASEHTTLNHILPAFDARMDEVYWGAFELKRSQDSGRLVAIEALAREQVTPPEQVVCPLGSDWYGLGSGYAFFDRFDADSKSRIKEFDETARPMASDIVRLARLDLEQGSSCVEAAQAKPVYIRDEVAWKKLPGRG